MALKVGGTTVINDARGLENISNIKTVNGSSILGSGDISVPTYTHPANHPASIITQDASNRFVSDADKQTWNNKVDLGGFQTLTNKTLNGVTLSGRVAEEVFDITDTSTVNLNPGSGTIQLWTLNGNRTVNLNNFLNGESVTLMVRGNGFTLAWTASSSIAWVNNGGTAPTLNANGYTAIVLWSAQNSMYGALVGNGA